MTTTVDLPARADSMVQEYIDMYWLAIEVGNKELVAAYIGKIRERKERNESAIAERMKGKSQ